MVLKKSNSGFNSGATQRITNRGTWETYRVNQHREQLIYIFLTVSQKGEKRRQVLGKCLQSIWDKLGWKGANLLDEQFHKIKDQFVPSVTFELSCSSTNKRNMWLLPNRFKSIMANTEFLHSVLPVLDLKLYENQESPLGYKHKTNRKYYATNIVAETQPMNECKKSRRRRTCHHRGIQRHHVLYDNQKIEKTVQNTQNPASDSQSSLDIIVYLPCYVDVRCANKNNVNRYKTKYCEKFLKSSTKSKGHVNGRYEYLKGWTREQILEDTYLALNDPISSNDVVKYKYLGGSFYSSPKTKNVYSSSQTNNASFDLCDFIFQNKPKIKQRKRRNDKQTENVSAPSESYNVFKYHKGSFIKVPKYITESLNQDTFEIPKKEKFNYILATDEPDECLEVIQSLEDENVTTQTSTCGNTCAETTLEEEVKDFEQSFLDVALTFHINDKNNVAHNIQQREEVYGKITIGKSYPPCFVIDLSDKVREKCYLVGKKINVNSSSWLITFQCKNYIEANVRLQNAIFEEWSCFITLHRLVELANSVKNEINSYSGSNIFESTILTQHNCNVDSNSSVIFCQSDKISSYLSVNETNCYESSDIVKCQDNDDIELQECPVCLLSFHGQQTMKLHQCKHTFCVKCWRTHVFCGMQQGFGKLTCLAVNCNNVLDIASVWNILPFEIIDRWQRQVLEKYIETSPYCNWCPSDTCQNVAMSLSTPLKKQFGQPVTCSCGHSWCGNCQDTPHWPASCDQVAAYKKLLEKAGVNNNFTYGVTDYFVRLKPCPQCKYPIEKKHGCSSILCRMCNHNFCWNCLKNFSSHIDKGCHGNDDNFVMYNLQNKLFFEMPFKYFTHCLETNKTLQTLNSSMEKCVFFYRKPFLDGRIKVQSFLNSLQIELDVIVQETVKCFNFIQKTYKFLEMFYLLIGFVHFKKSTKSKQLMDTVLSKCSQLQFVVCRLKEHTFGKSPQQIYEKTMLCKSLLSSGETIMSDLTVTIQYLQEMSKDVDTKPVAELDPLKHLRYK